MNTTTETRSWKLSDMVAQLDGCYVGDSITVGGTRSAECLRGGKFKVTWSGLSAVMTKAEAAAILSGVQK